MGNTVVILGAGPSGMMAAHAVAQYGLTPMVIDRDPDKTRRNSGVYYLHSDCGLALRSREVMQRVLGGEGLFPQNLVKAYAAKVYGQEVSSSSILHAYDHPQIQVYNAVEALEHLWEMYGAYVHKDVIEGFEAVWDYQMQVGNVVSTIPARVLFPDIAYNAVYANVHVSEAPETEAFVYYNVGPAISWYRCASLFGVFTAEYPCMLKPDITRGEWRRVHKVIGTSTPLPEYPWLITTGRYGAWDKACLTDTVYRQVGEQIVARGWV